MIVIEKTWVSDRNIGILDTPCYPARYYVGGIVAYCGEWIPICNDTHLYHRNLEDAETAYLKLLGVDNVCRSI